MIAVAGAVLVATAATATTPTDPKLREKVDQLLEVQALDQRVADIGWRLATSNLELCPTHTGATGLGLHGASQYAPAYRSAAVTAFALTEAGPGVQTVARGSPAWSAGIRPGDTLVSIQGANLARGPKSSKDRSKASYAETDAAMARIEALAPDQPAAVRIQRNAVTIDLTLTPELACASRFEMATGDALNANSNGNVVQVFGRLVLTLTRDDDLALVMAHELAHNVLGHNQAISKQRLPTGAGAAFSRKGRILRDFEREADRYGIFIAARAGYAYAQAPEFWRDLSASAGLGAWIASSHPTPGNRQASAQAVVAEIAALKSQGKPLVPAKAD